MRRSNRDQLTGLPNRDLLIERLKQVFAYADRHGSQIALMFLDLDDFKNINDKHGRISGDILLKEVAKRLRNCTRQYDTIARIGGDEFVVFINDMKDIHDIVKFTEKVRGSFRQPFDILGKSFIMTSSIGVAIYPLHCTNSESLLKMAEIAMCQAKKEGKIRFFGFCTHKRVDSCLDRAAELGWIHGIQAFYNYRMQAVGSMEDALRKCHEKGIGIFTVKSMGLCIKNEAELQGLPLPKDKLLTLLAGHSLSFEQAKLKAIWQNPHLTSICSLMPSVSIMQANASAAMDERPLDGEVARSLAGYADGTGRYFCRRCGVCETATPDRIPIFNVMESLMYARGYGSRDLAAKIFAQIPAEIRDKMISSDYSKAESKCPQKMPIAQLMREAYLELNG